MSDRDRAVAEPFFLAGAAGRLYCLHRPPAFARERRDAVLFVPPFAEEMNKARRMFALTAQRLSARGLGSLVVDLHGTGDSEGDFGDARWETWVADLKRATEWLVAQGYRTVHPVGLRFGALLAADLLREWPLEGSRLVLWQPVARGEAFLTQFLRLRLVASMMDSAREKESTEDLRRLLRAGEAIEVAGYLLAPELAAAIEQKSLSGEGWTGTLSVHWFEIVSDTARPLSPATARAVEALRKSGRDVTARAVKGEPFWSTIEIAVVPELIRATEAALGVSTVDE